MESVINTAASAIGFMFFIILTLSSIRIVRPTSRGLIERLGKYNRFAQPGLNLIIPIIDHSIYVNITEMMVDVEKQEIITEDSLNAQVAAQIYFKIKEDEDSVKKSQYNVNDVNIQIVALSRTSLRNIIGTMTLSDANSKRATINVALLGILEKETANWGIEIVRAEIKEIEAPEDVQKGMNKVVIAKNEKTAAIDFATAAETKADGEKRAAIKMAEAGKQAAILEAEGIKEAKVTVANGEAESIKLVNEAAENYFKGRGEKLRTLEAMERSLSKNTKVLITDGKSLSDIMASMVNIAKEV